MTGKLNLFGRTRILAALSGGADSVALTLALLETAQSLPELSVACAHFNHLLREESAEEQRFVESFCARKGIRLYLGEGDVRSAAKERKKGIEETAREMRYAFLESEANKNGMTVATAHTADDNAETILLNLTRGTGPAGLRGIPAERGNIIRPMLSVTRAEVEEYLALAGEGHIEDASNRDTVFSRNLIRHQVVPVLRSVNPSFVKAAARTAGLIAADEDFLSGEAEAFFKKHVKTDEKGVSMPVCELNRLHPALRGRVIRLMIGSSGEMAHTRAVEKLAEGNNPHAEAWLPGGRVARRVYGELYIGEPGFNEPEYFFTSENVSLYEKINKTFNSFIIKSDTITGKVILRNRLPGDALTMSGGSKTLKKLYIEKKIPRHLRDTWPVLSDDAGIIAVLGIGTDKSREPAEGCQAVRLTIRMLDE